MAKSDAVWGIDIGNCSLKALRCRPAEQDGRVLAEAFDYIEYPKILTQPGAEPSELVHDALTEFLSRNTLRGDGVAISVPGQTGLARFVKLPPVESKKIPDIVKFEARQQIPFDLNDVIWDYQRMGGGAEESGFLLETEIGLFAMKRDQVLRALEPFTRVGIEVDLVQLTPLALYNFMCFDQLEDLPPPDEYDPDNPPLSTVVLSMGTDATDLVITNGFRVWQRSIPVGGNHFTKALTKELKLTFGKAEHLKRNAATAEDPKAVFQAMRPVFNDLLTELQRSIGYFNSLDRAAQIQRVLAMGNGVKLPGLRRYLAQSLGFEVARLESYQKLAGPEVLGAPAFQENQLCFPVCYGLALQGLKKSPLRTNLLPREIVKDRVINAKKPWAVAAAAVLLAACTISFVSHVLAWSTVKKDKFDKAEVAAKAVADKANRDKTDADAALTSFGLTQKVGVNVVESVEGRLHWMELLKALNVCLPRDAENMVPEDISERNELHIRSLDCQHMNNFEFWIRAMNRSGWYSPTDEDKKADTALTEVLAAQDTLVTGMGTGYPGPSGAGYGPATGGYPAASAPGLAAAGVGAATAAAGAGTAAAGPKQGVKGEGWLVQITGYHYHNSETAGGRQGAEFVRTTLINRLRTGTVFLPTDPSNPSVGKYVSMKKLGIAYPVLVNPGSPYKVSVLNPLAAAWGEGSGGAPGYGAAAMVPGAAGYGPKMSAGYGNPSGYSPGSPGLAGPTPYGPKPGTGGPGMMGPKGPTTPSSGPYGPRAPYGPRTPGAPGSFRPDTDSASPAGAMPENYLTLQKFQFQVQFIWQPLSPAERQQKEKQDQTAQAGQGTPAGPTVPAEGPAAVGVGTPLVPAPGPAGPGPTPNGGAAPMEPPSAAPSAPPPAPGGPSPKPGTTSP